MNNVKEYPRRIRRTALLVFLTGSLISILVIWGIYTVQVKQKHDLVQSVANSRLNLFLEAMDKRVNVSDAIGTLVFDDDGKKTDLEGISEEIYRDTHPMISWFALAPDGVVSYVYPQGSTLSEGTDLMTSKNAVGLNYSSLSQRNYFAKMGDNLFVVFNPVYLREKKTGYQRFWGFAIVAGPMASILKDGRITELDQNGYYYSLKVRASYNREESVIASNHDMTQEKNAEVYTSSEPGYTYTLTVTPKSGWCDHLLLAITAGLCGILTILITLLSVSLLKQRHSNTLLEQISASDRLTGLPNSRSFETAEALLNHNKQAFTLFFLDANYFKQVNDTYGHETGNEVLCEYGVRLQKVFAGQVYRLGGDEFAAIVEGALSTEEAQAYGQKVKEALQEPYESNGRKISLSMSVGWALADGSQNDETVLNRADQMMYQNKQKYHAEMHEKR